MYVYRLCMLFPEMSCIYIQWKDFLKTLEIFAAWFIHYASLVKEIMLFLLLDGLLTNISIQLSRTFDKYVIIFKFSRQITNVMQPLNVSCIGWLNWVIKNMLQQQNFPDKQLFTKYMFINKLCATWDTGMKKDTISVALN